MGVSTRHKDTSWGNVAQWYHQLIEQGKGTYQKEVILPHLLRLLQIKKGELIADIACGQGFLSRALYAHGARVYGIDASPELIEIARKETARAVSHNVARDIRFEVAKADAMPFIKDASVQQAVIVMALQNIPHADRVIKECRRILQPRGKLHIVLNHPAFRVPKASAWGYDTAQKIQYRRIDRYLSESTVPIQMHPGANPSEITTSFHRPLQYYIKALGKYGLLVNDMEEWISHKKNEPGPRAAAENLARKEIPLFLYMSAIRV